MNMMNAGVFGYINLRTNCTFHLNPIVHNNWLCKCHRFSVIYKKPKHQVQCNFNEIHSQRQLNDSLIVLSKLSKIRSSLHAPVDYYGPSKLVDHKLPERIRNYQLLISVMLSSQTKDLVLGPVFSRLKTSLVKSDSSSEILTVENMLTHSEQSLSVLLEGVSFHQRKSKYILEMSKILMEKYDGNVPNDVNALLSFPGVGPKMTHIVMKEAFGIVSGIAVDTHVHRISNRLDWVRTWHAKSNGPERTRVQLESFLPESVWPEVNQTLVAFGQTICSAMRPQCEICPIQEYCVNKNLIPLGDRARNL